MSANAALPRSVRATRPPDRVSRTNTRAERWDAHNQAGTAVATAWLIVDTDCALLYTLSSTEPYARWRRASRKRSPRASGLRTPTRPCDSPSLDAHAEPTSDEPNRKHDGRCPQNRLLFAACRGRLGVV
jgi:hypothetical protein